MARKLLIRAAVFLGGFGFVAGSVLFALAYFTVDIPDPNAYVNSQSTIIQYSNGEEIGRVGTQNRQIVPLAKIPLNVRYAVLAAEDRNFYSNKAFSITGILRAVVNNLRGGSLQGGSTITQQYAKTAFLTPSRTIQRKVKELVISIKLENQLSKDQIFESYLNTIYFGRGSYGVMTASQQYFNRNVDQLTNSQAAVIASILRSPGLYDPKFKEGNAERLANRFEYVKNNMIEAGWLDEKAAAAMKLPTVAPRSTSGQLSGPKGHIIEAVQKELAKLERAYKEQFNTAFNMIANEKMTLTSKFFETLASRVIHVYEVANRDVENWLKAVIAPMESQVREHQLQLRRRLESIKRIYKATDTLEDRILELENIEKSIRAQITDLHILRQHMGNALAFEGAEESKAA